MSRLLLLAGTAEARQLSVELSRAGVDAIASLAGVTRAPVKLDLPMRIGGFGGASGFLEFLAGQGIAAVLDATHPFAARISHRTAQICKEKGIPYLHVLREEWSVNECDKWVSLEKECQLAPHVDEGSTVFLATGLQNLTDFANLPKCRIFARRIDVPTTAFPFPGGVFLQGHPPFSVKDEVALFERLGVDWLVVKNSGGTASRAKLDAARELGISVALINRPPQPDAPRAATVAAAMDWVRGLRL